MTAKNPPPHHDAPSASTGPSLRQQAEAIAEAARPPEPVAPRSPAEVRQALHELRVQQIELEMQNEELRRAQHGLDAERIRYFDLYDLAPVGYVTVSGTGLILQANLSAAALLAAARGVLIKRPISSIILPADHDVFYLQRGRAVGTGEPQSSELRMVKNDGTPIWVRLVAIAARDSDGAPELRLVLDDITRRKQAEEEISKLNAELERQRVDERARELRDAYASLTDFKAALDQHALVSITDAGGQIIYANDKFCTVSKYSREELVGQDHRIVNSGHHPKAFIRDLWQTITSGRVWKGELKNRAKDGSFFWVDTTIVPFLGYGGKSAQFVAIRTDITERNRAEVALQASEERMRLAAEAADIGVWERDLKSDTLIWDERMFAIYGLPVPPQGRVSHQDWRERVLPADLAEQEARLQHTIATCGRDQREFRIVRASDHAVRFIQAAEMVIAGAYGQPLRVVGINLDITERKRAEEEIGKLNTDLQRHAGELVVANKELEAFSYSVSHDLRAPLRAVDGFSRLILKQQAGRLDDNGRRMLGAIRGETQRMGQLIDDLLAFSRLGRQQIEPVPINMHALALEVFDELAALEPERKLRRDLQVLPPARGTQALIRQVWVNLVANAIKFTKGRETGEIEIGVREGEDDGPVYYVKDNGAGFDMRHAEKLFGVFHRLHSQQEFSGTGVGLALVQRIVQRHGGRVWAEAEVDQGAIFYFTLPNQQR